MKPYFVILAFCLFLFNYSVSQEVVTEDLKNSPTESFEKYSYLLIQYPKINGIEDRLQTHNATGFFLKVGKKLFLVSNYHVITGADGITLTFKNSYDSIRVRYYDDKGRADYFTIDLEKVNSSRKILSVKQYPDIFLIQISKVPKNAKIYAIGEILFEQPKFADNKKAFSYQYGSIPGNSIQLQIDELQLKYNFVSVYALFPDDRSRNDPFSTLPIPNENLEDFLRRNSVVNPSLVLGDKFDRANTEYDSIFTKMPLENWPPWDSAYLIKDRFLSQLDISRPMRVDSTLAFLNVLGQNQNLDNYLPNSLSILPLMKPADSLGPLLFPQATFRLDQKDNSKIVVDTSAFLNVLGQNQNLDNYLPNSLSILPLTDKSVAPSHYNSIFGPLNEKETIYIDDNFYLGNMIDYSLFHSNLYYGEMVNNGGNVGEPNTLYTFLKPATYHGASGSPVFYSCEKLISDGKVEEWNEFAGIQSMIVESLNISVIVKADQLIAILRSGANIDGSKIIVN